MEQLKFAPAPWQFLFNRSPESIPEYHVLPQNAHDGEGWGFKEIDIGDKDGRLIAKVSARTTKDAIAYEEFEQSAKLIVAAPDLLNDLLMADRLLRSIKGQSWDEWPEAIKIRETIDKATK